MNNWYKLLSLISASFGFIGSFYFILGTLTMSESDIKNLSGTYFDANSFMLKSFISQKGDFIIGAILIAIAFALQVINILIEKRLSRNILFSKIFWIVYFLIISIFLSLSFIVRIYIVT